MKLPIAATVRNALIRAKLDRFGCYLDAYATEARLWGSGASVGALSAHAFRAPDGRET